jgi:hypothetical protein
MTRPRSPADRRVRIRSVDGLTAPAPPSRLWVAWPYEPLLTLGGGFLLLGLLLTDWSGTRLALVGAVISIALGLAGVALGIAVAWQRRRWEREAFLRASAEALRHHLWERRR